MQLLYNLTALLSLIELSTIEQRFTEVIKDICTIIAIEQRLYTFIHANAKATHDATNGRAYPDVTFALHTLDTPNSTAVISIDRLAPIKNYTELFHHSLLSVVQLCQEKQADRQILRDLWQRLEGNRNTRLMLIFDDTASEAYITVMLKYCVDQNAINVIGLQPDMTVKEHSYWTLQIFPKQRTVRRMFSIDYRELFPRHMENMHGHPFRIIGNAWYPLIYNFTTKHEPLILSGYGGRALREYSRHHNATISVTIVFGKSEFWFLDAHDLLANKSADIGLLSPIQIRDPRLSFSTVLRFEDWCLMLPVEKPLPRFTFYYKILDLNVIIVFCVSTILISYILTVISHWNGWQENQLCFEALFKLSVLQRLLGAPFQAQRRMSIQHKFISIIISLAGIIISNSYLTYLQTYTVTAPVNAYMNTVDDIVKNGIHIGLSTISLHWIKREKRLPEILRNYTFFKNVTDLLVLRNSFDTRYAYSVNEMWYIYNEQQKYFTKPIFRISNLCLGKNAPMAFILQANSIYQPTINEFMVRLVEAGLISFWLRHSFVELVAMGEIKLDDLNKQEWFVPLKLADMYVVHCFMSVLIALSILCFLLEIFWMRIRKLWQMWFGLVLKRIKKLHFRVRRP